MTVGKAFEQACEVFLTVYRTVIFTIGQIFVYHVLLPIWLLTEGGTTGAD